MNVFLFISVFHEFKSFLVQEFKLFQEFNIYRGFCKIHKISEFWFLQSLLRDWL